MTMPERAGGGVGKKVTKETLLKLSMMIFWWWWGWVTNQKKSPCVFGVMVPKETHEWSKAAKGL